MTEVIVFPDTEGLVCAWLTDQFAGRDQPLPWGTKVPNPRPANFGRVLRTGGGRASIVVERAQLTFEGWGNTETAAFQIIQLCAGLVSSMPRQDIPGLNVHRVPDDEVSGIVNLPDPSTAQARYTFTASVYVRGATL